MNTESNLHIGIHNSNNRDFYVMSSKTRACWMTIDISKDANTLVGGNRTNELADIGSNGSIVKYRKLRFLDYVKK